MKILGVKIDNLTRQEFITQINSLLNNKHKSYAVTVNPEFITLAQKDNEFKDILNNSSLSLPDGIGVVWASWLLGNKIKERVAGTDFVYSIAQLAEKEGYRVFLLGGKKGVAEKAAKKLKMLFSNLSIVGSSSADPEDVPEILKKEEVDILFVAYGHPKQEKWIKRNLQDIRVKLALGVGGALDYVSETKVRAPLWVRKIGFEWLFRLLYEPWRLKRQLSLPHFILLVLKEKFR